MYAIRSYYEHHLNYIFPYSRNVAELMQNIRYTYGSNRCSIQRGKQYSAQCIAKSDTKTPFEGTDDKFTVISRNNFV